MHHPTPPSTLPAPIVAVENLRKRFDGQVVLDGVSSPPPPAKWCR